MDSRRYVGKALRRNEDPRLLRGGGTYANDLDLPGMLHAGFVRSPHAHASIGSVDLSAGRRAPGVVAAYSGLDLPDLTRPAGVPALPPGLRAHGLPPLASGTVRYVGEPVAVVLAENEIALADAIEAVAVEYEALEPVTDPERALVGDALVWPDVEKNLASNTVLGYGDVQEGRERADVVVSAWFEFARSAGAAMEPRAVVAAPGIDGFALTIWVSSQIPHDVRTEIAGYLGLDPETVRVVTPDVGGGFGVKARIYQEEYVVAALALRHDRPVRFVATRTEDLMTTCHGRGQVHDASLAARADGTILALTDRIVQDMGAYTPNGVPATLNTARHLMGPYRVPAISVEILGVYTNRVMTSPLRGGGRPQGIYVMERLLDKLARELDLDRAEVRRRNLIPPDAFPYDTGFPGAGGTTITYDSGDYPAYLDRALSEIGYRDFEAQRKAARASGRCLGLGLSNFIEATGIGAEAASVRIDEDGGVRASLGTPSQGQGHATTFAQIVADRLGVVPENVGFTSGDTSVESVGTGTIASRTGQYGGNAIALAADAVREKALGIVSEMLEIAPQDLELRDGCVSVRGLPDRRITLAEVAREAARRGETLGAGRMYAPVPATTFAGGTNAAIVEVDVETGNVTILRYLVVHDSGVIINPMIVEGQVHGGVAHGIGNALHEAAIYGDDGQLLTATFADYAIPGVGEVPTIETVHFETPSPFNPEGIKGAGEGGTIAAIPTIVSAIEDALSPYGVELTDVPVTAETIVRLVAKHRSVATANAGR